jgi:hypothetical protein
MFSTSPSNVRGTDCGVAPGRIEGFLYVCSPGLDVAWKRAMTHDRWPKLERGSGYKRWGQFDDAQIIVQVGATATVVSAASHANARSAFTPLTGSPDVLTTRIQEEYVGAAVPALGSALQPSAR